MAGLVPVTRAVKNQEDEVPRGVDSMEVDALYGPDNYYDDLERGFRGPCFFCQRQGHIQRMCPRRSAGLPRVQAPQPGYQRGHDW